MTRSPPTIETDRLILRARRLGDFPAYAAMWADDRVVKYIGGKPLSEEAAWQKFARSVGLWTLCGFGPWTLEEKSSGRFVGDMGPAIYRREIDYDGTGRPEFGWTVVPDASGKGYATEGLGAAIEWTEKNVSGDTFFCIIEGGNLASLRVAEKVGFRPIRPVVYHGDEVLLLERPSSG